jgi:hypothetical protein
VTQSHPLCLIDGHVERWTVKRSKMPLHIFFSCWLLHAISISVVSLRPVPHCFSPSSLSHTHGSGGCRRGQRIGRRGGQPASGAPRAASGIHGGPPVGHPVRAAAGHPWRPAAETTVSRIQQYAVPVFMDGAWDGE